MPGAVVAVMRVRWSLPLNGAIALICLLFANSSMAATGPSTPPVRAALVIGNAHYASVGPLKNPANDADDVCAALRGLGYRVTCAVDVDTRARLRALIEDFTEALPSNAVSVVYYAGHAVQVGGENYLVPVSARLPDQDALVRQSVSLSFVMRQLRATESYLTLIVLDACRNNPLATPGQSLPAGLAQITDIPDATELVYATAANQPALDGEGRNGILTKHLLAHLKEPGSVDDLFKRVSLGVQSETAALGHPQTPALYTNFSGQYCLVRCTDLEMLQAQHRDAEQQIADLQARVAAGDQGAARQLAEARSANARLLEQIRKKDEEAKKAAQAEKERQKQTFVPPAF